MTSDEDGELEYIIFLTKSEMIYILVMLQRIEVGPDEDFTWETYRTATRDELQEKLRKKVQELGGMRDQREDSSD